MDRVPRLNVLFGCFRLVTDAQFDRGSLTGLVDAPMAVVPGAKIAPNNPKTGINITTRSNDARVCKFPADRVSFFKITTKMPGFSLAKGENVSFNFAPRMRVELNLAVGRVSQAGEVCGRAARKPKWKSCFIHAN